VRVGFVQGLDVTNPATGALALQGSSQSVADAYYLAADPGGQYLYVSGFIFPNGQLSGFNILSSSLSAQFGPLSDGVNVQPKLAADPLGRYLFVTHNSSTVGFTMLPIGATSLTYNNVFADSLPEVAVDPTGTYVYFSGA
jgi:DNA-binding beta-propeller fold protein YncE